MLKIKPAMILALLAYLVLCALIALLDSVLSIAPVTLFTASLFAAITIPEFDVCDVAALEGTEYAPVARFEDDDTLSFFSLSPDNVMTDE